MSIDILFGISYDQMIFIVVTLNLISSVFCIFKLIQISSSIKKNAVNLTNQSNFQNNVSSFSVPQEKEVSISSALNSNYELLIDQVIKLIKSGFNSSQISEKEQGSQFRFTL